MSSQISQSNDLQLEDRPINPNKQYLEQKEKQYEQKKKIHQYLKKQKINEKVLPCFRQIIQTKNKSKPKPQQNKKTKAQLYEQIKRKNRQKFGQWESKRQKNQLSKSKQKNQKLNPKNMTVPEKAKTKSNVFIDTTQKRIKKMNQNQQQSNFQGQKDLNSLNNTSKSCKKIKEIQSARTKYQKLLELMKRQKEVLDRQKDQFQKKKDYVQFKKLIQKQNTVPFVKEIKQKYQNKRKQVQNQKQCKANTKNGLKNQLSIKKSQKFNNNYIQTEKDIKQIKQVQKTYDKEYHQQINKQSQQLQNKKSQLESKIYSNHYSEIQINDRKNQANSSVNISKYTIEKLNEIPNFTIYDIKQYIYVKSLYPEKNHFYQQALQVFEKALTAKQRKINQTIKCVGSPNRFQNQQDQTLKDVEFKRKVKDGQRITKYKNGWIQVWTPGVQRLMMNKDLGYKVVWLKNGDIKQEWKGKQITSYYSKEKQIVQITCAQNPQIYLFRKANQLQQYSYQQNKKVVFFKDGNIGQFPIQQEDMFYPKNYQEK